MSVSGVAFWCVRNRFHSLLANLRGANLRTTIWPNDPIWALLCANEQEFKVHRSIDRSFIFVFDLWRRWRWQSLSETAAAQGIHATITASCRRKTQYIPDCHNYTEFRIYGLFGNISVIWSFGKHFPYMKFRIYGLFGYMVNFTRTKS